MKVQVVRQTQSKNKNVVTFSHHPRSRPCHDEPTHPDVPSDGLCPAELERDHHRRRRRRPSPVLTSEPLSHHMETCQHDLYAEESPATHIYLSTAYERKLPPRGLTIAVKRQTLLGILLQATILSSSRASTGFWGPKVSKRVSSIRKRPCT
jgi:hypothetical protein